MEPMELTLDPHTTTVLSLSLQHELERLKDAIERPAPLSRDLVHNSRGAAVSVLAVLQKVSPEAAESWARVHGSPLEWKTEAAR